MCKQYRNILNPALPLHSDDMECKGNYNYFPYFTPATLMVPCGYCEQCQEIKNKEWRLRLQYEFKACTYCFKDELTYSDTHVSRLGDFMVFNKTHIQLFLKRLRFYIERQFGKDVKIKYFLVCEYGGQFTHRPHYHILIFVYGDKMSPAQLNRLVSLAWTYGYTNQNKGRKAKKNWSPNSKVVQSVAGINYVTKYLFKDKSFFDGLLNQASDVVRSYLAKEFKVTENELLSLFEHEENMFYDVIKSLRKSPFAASIPFKMQSQRIGISLLEYLSFDDACRGTFNDIFSSQLQFIPMYYKRKLLYDYNHVTKCFVKNEDYIHYLWEKKRNEFDNVKHSLLDDYPQLPNGLMYTYTSFANPLGDNTLWQLHDFFLFLQNVCPADKKVNIPLYRLEDVAYHYRCLMLELEKRDLFYSSILRCEFKITDKIYSDIDVFTIDGINKDIQRYIVERYDSVSPLTEFFINLENWNLQNKQEMGEYICKQIKDRYLAEKFDADLLTSRPHKIE